ncbi:CMP-N-acetylneuraminate-beta-galactosamide-alpha-2, 3-sialyltransferase 2 [Platysternon megacephalum]|uniref:CMP-N-acetylneuraminate-beta-galactosamide-alpha-2, 3-sialyltransferase 2 n=1 Tax=Platysternon megacephalum TaxID=55544 RepID=A0A4D9DC74_9SAUR|nr:CMP-N-acetylneuraminate-beta-galactosamide-alpha-2, 3-sialyltransferase 2 [Platysternon megacephalum]
MITLCGVLCGLGDNLPLCYSSTYAPVKPFLRVDKEKVQIYNPAFFKYIHDRWTEHHGRYPSTGMLVLFFALHVCDEVGSGMVGKAARAEPEIWGSM